ncbi:MAG: hypothetical protein ABEJ27_06650 [Halodesulfurarchaeum sp.]
MDVDRGMSTPLDVALAMLLVAASVGTLATIPNEAPPSPEVKGSVLLGSRLEVAYRVPDGRATVSGTVGSLLQEAARAKAAPLTSRERAFVEAVTGAVDRRLHRIGSPVQLVAVCPQRDGLNRILRVGLTPPGRVPVRSAVYGLPRRGAPASSDPTETCRPLVIVRRWSP